MKKRRPVLNAFMLQRLEEVFISTARLVGNPLALRMDRGALQDVVEAVRHGVVSP